MGFSFTEPLPEEADLVELGCYLRTGFFLYLEEQLGSSSQEQSRSISYEAVQGSYESSLVVHLGCWKGNGKEW